MRMMKIQDGFVVPSYVVDPKLMVMSRERLRWMFVVVVVA
jgi:hypothetical protein